MDVAQAAEKISKVIGISTAAIALVVGASTGLTTCSKQSAERYAGFRTSVANEESYWKSLYDDYLTVFGPDFDKSVDRKEQKIIAVYTMAQREVPSFSEFQVSESEKLQAICRISRIQTSLLNSILEQQSVPGQEGLKEVLESRSFVGKAGGPNSSCGNDIASVRASSETLAPGESKSSPNPSPTVIPTMPQAGSKPIDGTVQLSPLSATGWDVDLFWCKDKNQQSNWDNALSYAAIAASAANSGRAIAAGVTLGRIQVKSIEVARERGIRGGAAPRRISYDSAPGEQRAAEALRQLLDPRGDILKVNLSNGSKTRWYLSVFFCSN